MIFKVDWNNAVLSGIRVGWSFTRGSFEGPYEFGSHSDDTIARAAAFL